MDDLELPKPSDSASPSAKPASQTSEGGRRNRSRSPKSKGTDDIDIELPQPSDCTDSPSARVQSTATSESRSSRGSGRSSIVNMLNRNSSGRTSNGKEYVHGSRRFSSSVELTRTNKVVLKIQEISMMFLPGIVAIIPVAAPFGNAFAKDGPNGIAQNWAYYFVYNTVGWGGMWIKMCLWNCRVWKQPFFFPFMVCDEGWFSFNWSLVAFIIPEIFSTLFYMVGYWIFQNPVPWGTITFGVPCFVVQFIAIYYFIIPYDRRSTIADHVKIFQAFIPFVLFVLNLCYNIFFTYIIYVKRDEWEQANNWSETTGTLLVVVCFLCIAAGKEGFLLIPYNVLMGAVDPEGGKLWRFAFVAQFRCFYLWMFPGLSDSKWVALPILAGFSYGKTSYKLILLRRAVKKMVGESVKARRSELLEGPEFESAFDRAIMLIYTLMADMWCVASFLIIFVYNMKGPNKQYMYFLDKIPDSKFKNGVIGIGLNLAGAVLMIILFCCVAASIFPPKFRQKIWQYYVSIFTYWYWLILWLIISTTLASGACMIMKHDGMDISFRFEEWKGTPPF